VASDLVAQLQKRKIENIPLITPSELNNTEIQNMPSLNKFESITTEKILKAISKLKNGSSPRIDKITIDLLKKHDTIFCILLCHIFNLCISQNLIPKNFNVAIITPIHKKGPTTSYSNFRPISVISNTAKIFE